jgi:hypothetical protein
LTNGKTFAQVLRNFVFICLSLARALLQADLRTENEEDATDLYEQAIALHLKLTMFEKAEEKRLPILYEELSNTYAKLYSSMKNAIQVNLVKALDETTDPCHQRSLEFRLGNLCFDQKEFFEADQFWRRALKKVQDPQTAIRTILEKLIEKNKENLSRPEDDTDDDELKEQNEDNESHFDVQSFQPDRRQSTKSISDKVNPEVLVQACLELEDDETALKYLKKCVFKLESTLKPIWPHITIKYEQLPMIKFFHSLLLQTVTLVPSSSLKSKQIPDKYAWTRLLQAYTKIFTIAVRLSNSSNEIAKANLATFEMCQKLYDIPNNLITIYDLLFKGDSDNLEWKKLIDLLPSDQSTDILMRIAAYNVLKEKYDEALKIYCTLQNKIQNQETLKSAVNYAILNIFELYMFANEDYRVNIMAIDIHSPSIPIFDRILLCRQSIDFWKELEDEIMASQFKKALFNLQNEAWTVGDLEPIDCIGHVLTKVEDNVLTCAYWDELRYIYNEMLPNYIVTLLYSTGSTFEQILRTTQEMNNKLFDNIISLAESYKLLATYEKKGDYNEDACESLEKAIVILSKDPSANDKVEQLKAKVNTLKDAKMYRTQRSEEVEEKFSES